MAVVAAEAVTHLPAELRARALQLAAAVAEDRIMLRELRPL
jgi:hypothetical protein